MGCSGSSQEEVEVVSSPVKHYQTQPPSETFNDYQSHTSDDSDLHFFETIIPYFNNINVSAEKEKEFYNLISNKMGELYTGTLSKIQEKLMKQEIGVDDLKVNFSKTVLLQILYFVNRLQNKSNWKANRIKFYKNIALCQKKIIEFLKFKYPRNKKGFVPTQLQELFYGINDSQHTDYDLLINAGINFDYESIKAYERKEVIRQIKKFLNAIIIESNRSFDMFRLRMEDVFKDLDGSFKIGRKISENTRTYSDFESQNLQIHSPEIFRVVIKWISSMEGVFINTLERLKEFKYLKILQQNDEEFSYFPLYTGKSSIISSLTSALEPGSKKYKKQQEDQQNALANFNDNLAKILTKKTDIPEINQNEIKTIKYAKYISRFIEFLAVEKLVYLITELTNLRQKMQKKNRKGVDLINCDVNDLLRSRFMGTKLGIMEVFKRLKNMQEKKLIKIIRIKNRFGTPLNDTLINFKFVGQEEQSFLICELQLILKKDSHSLNAKYKAYENINHVLYELQRSIFGPMAEMSLLLTHHDTRMGYEKKIKLEKSSLKNMRCPDNEVLECEYDFQLPYACSLCSEFYHIHQNSFPIHRCLNCNFYVCPACLFEFDPEMMEECYQKELYSYIRDNYIQELEEFEDYGMFFFDPKYLKVSSIQKKGKNFFDCLEEKMTDLEQQYAFVFSFKQGKKNLGIYTTSTGEILPTFYDFLPRFERKSFKNQKFGAFDIILFLDPNCSVQKKPMKETNLTTIPLVKIQFNIKKVKEIYYFKWQNNFCMIDIGEQIRDNDSITSFQNISIDKAAEFEKALENYKARDGQLLLDYLDIDKLDFSDNEIQSVRFAKLKSNRLKDISPLLKFDSLEEIDVSRNEVYKFSLNKLYKKLRIIDMSENYLEHVNGLTDQHLPNSKEINFSNNNLSAFPRMHLSKLLWLNLDNNHIRDLEGFSMSFLPKLRKLSICQNEIEEIPEVDMPELLDLDAENNKIQNLNFLLKCDKIQQVLMNKNEIVSIPKLELDYLEKLELSNNKLSQISELSNCVFNKLKYLNLSNNKIKEIPILEFEELTEADFSYNEIEEIHNFYKCQILMNLQILDLSHNRISDSCIFIFQSLKTLDISHNKIKDLSSFVHCALPALEQIDASFNSITRLPKFEQPELLKMSFEGNQLTTMQSLISSTLPKLKTLNLSYNKIDEFLSGEFPSLEDLLLQRNQLVKINEVPMQHLEMLKNLNMSENKINELHPVHLQSLEKLQLNKNNISDLQIFKTSTLPMIKTIDLRFNTLATFPSMNLPSILILLLDSNEISDMMGIANGETPNLQELHLSNNKIKDLKVLRMQKLNFLNLQRNLLSEIHPLTNYNTPELSILNFKKNQIQTLCSLDSGSLTEIDLSSNKIINILPFFKSILPKILIIKLNSNQIEGELPRANFPSLKSLDLSKNSITGLKDFSYHSKLPKMDTFKINNNKIQQLGEFKFPKLKDINISNNLITKIEDFGFSELPKIQKLNFHNNQIVELPRLTFNTLIVLNLDQNNISNLDEEFERSELPSLQRLFLRGNKLKTWPEDLYLDKLSKLNLAENQLTEFININKNSVPELKELNLKKNRIEEFHQVNLPKMILLNLDGNPLIELDIKAKELLSMSESKVNKNLKLTLNKKSSERENAELEVLKLKEKFSAV